MTEKTSAAKAVNYTVEQTSMMVAEYTANPTAATVEAIASKLGKTVRSVVAKLSREGVYKKAERVSKTGQAIIKKDDLATQFQKIFNLTEAEADSLTKANKTALVKIIVEFIKLNDANKA